MIEFDFKNFRTILARQKGSKNRCKIDQKSKQNKAHQKNAKKLQKGSILHPRNLQKHEKTGVFSPFWSFLQKACQDHKKAIFCQKRDPGRDPKSCQKMIKKRVPKKEPSKEAPKRFFGAPQGDFKTFFGPCWGI